MCVYLFVGGVGVIAADVSDPGLDFVVLEVLLECLLYTPIGSRKQSGEWQGQAREAMATGKSKAWTAQKTKIST